MSGDPEQEYFADGIVDDIITALTRMRWLFIIARNSSFTYKGRAVDVKQVGRELGIRYLLEGGVRKSANRIRITAQLIDATTGAHIWAERYDRNLTDIFAVQDEISECVAGAIEPELLKIEGCAAIAKPENLSAWDTVRQGMWHFYQVLRENGLRARELRETWADTTTSTGRPVMTILSGIAEFERELINGRTGGGRTRALENGVQFGRPSKLSTFQRREAIARKEAGEPVRMIAQSYGVHHSQISRLK